MSRAVNRLGWPAYDRALAELVARADKPPSLFEATATRVADRRDQELFADTHRTARWIRETPSKLALWDRRVAALEALANGVPPSPDAGAPPDAAAP